ncbi:hypothetical protein J5N97_016377 [Dioscorea zingiberensis]|uniref:Uncharacterized protein n=1 Tax=Dioscorea zingiberensis TaxID=325984 RepID=A0A9D5CKX4_9LILI|nr:hypothetical protein J5N97_016377 [Dioscorea zingiberensis]
MKLLGSHNIRKKGGECSTSRTTSPSKLEEMEFSKNCLLSADVDEEEDNSENPKVSSVMLVNQGKQSNSCPKDVTKHIQARSLEEDGNGYDSWHDNGSACSFEFHKGERTLQNPVIGPFFRHLPSKWNDAEKWLGDIPEEDQKVLAAFLFEKAGPQPTLVDLIIKRIKEKIP